MLVWSLAGLTFAADTADRPPVPGMQVWFDGFAQAYLADPVDIIGKWFPLLQDVTGFDFTAEPQNAALVKLMSERGPEVAPPPSHPLLVRD